MNSYLIVLFILTGVIAGYLTNLYAVRWLFGPIKKKGIFPVWDVSIVSTDKKKQKLIESLADCVTNRILTSDVLREGIPDTFMEKHLYQMMNQILEQDSSKRIHTVLWKDIPGFEEAKQRGNRYIELVITKKITPLFCSILKQGDITTCLTEKQAHSIAENLYELLEKEIEEYHISERVLKTLLTTNRELTLKEIIGIEQWEVLKERVFYSFLNEKLNGILKDRERLESVLDEIISEMGIPEMLSEFQRTIGEKKIGELISQSDLESIFSYFWNETGIYWKTVEGRRVLRNRKKELKNFLLSMDVPLGEMLSEETWDQIEEWMQSNIPELIPPMADFIKENEEELNEVIERSIRIAAEKNNKSEYLVWLEEMIQLFIVSQIQISERLQKILETIKENDSDAVVEQLLNILKNQTVSNLVQEIGNKKNRSLWKELRKNPKWITKIQQSIYDYIKEKPVSWVCDRFSVSLPELVCKKGKNLLFNYIEKNPERVTDQLLRMLEPFYSELQTVSVSDLEQEWLEKINQLLYHKTKRWIQGTEKKQEIVTNIEQWLLKDGKKWLKQYSQDHAEVFTDKIQNQLIEQWYRWEQGAENTPIGQVFTFLNKEERKKEIVSSVAQRVREGMEQALQGQIHYLIVDALNQLKPNELCSQVERLMGGELKYLSYFGGFLGFLIAAGICHWAVPTLSVYGSPTTWIGGIISVGSMGIIGVITNIVAINMLFRPRKPIRWLAKSKYLSLFSEGVILQNQEKFAKSMAKYVSEELVSEKAVQQLYEANYPDFPKQLKQWVDKKGMALLKKNRNDIAEELVKWIMQYGKGEIKQVKEWLETRKIGAFVSAEQFHYFIKEETMQALLKETYHGWCIANGDHPIADYSSDIDILGLLSNWMKAKERIWLEKQISLEEIAAQREEWYRTRIAVQWTLEQKKQFHFFLDRIWEQVDTKEQKENALTWMIQKSKVLKESDTLVGEVQIADRSVEEWVNIILEQNMEAGIDWFYHTVIKKKIEQMFGYEESGKMEGDDWWENIQKSITRFGMRSIIEPIFRDAIWELKEVQLPLYLKEKKQELKEIVCVFLRERIYSITVGELIECFLGQDYPMTLNRILFCTIWKNPTEMGEVLRKLGHMLLSLILDQAPGVYLHLLQMDSLVAMEKRAHHSLETIWNSIWSMEQQKQIIAEKTACLVVPMLMKTQVKELTDLLPEDSVDVMIQKIVSEKNVEAVLEEVAECIGNRYSVGQLICMEEAEQSVQNIWNYNRERIEAAIQSIAAEQIWNIGYGWNMLPESLKMECSTVFVETVGEAFQTQLREIMDDLNLYTITEERLLSLTPEEMEKTIRAFANPIFKTLYALGGLGAVGGLNGYIAVIIYLIERRNRNS